MGYPSPIMACQEWSECLDKGGHRGRILSVLLAVEPQGPELALYTSNSTQVIDEATDECFYPPNIDPESWECDCYENMMLQCADIEATMSGYDVQVCVKAFICSTEIICEDWFDAHCTSTAITEMMTQIEFLKLSDGDYYDASLLEADSREANALGRGKTCNEFSVKVY